MEIETSDTSPVVYYAQGYLIDGEASAAKRVKFNWQMPNYAVNLKQYVLNLLKELEEMFAKDAFNLHIARAAKLLNNIDSLTKKHIKYMEYFVACCNQTAEAEKAMPGKRYWSGHTRNLDRLLHVISPDSKSLICHENSPICIWDDYGYSLVKFKKDMPEYKNALKQYLLTFIEQIDQYIDPKLVESDLQSALKAAAVAISELSEEVLQTALPILEICIKDLNEIIERQVWPNAYVEDSIFAKMDALRTVLVNITKELSMYTELESLKNFKA